MPLSLLSHKSKWDSIVMSKDFKLLKKTPQKKSFQWTLFKKKKSEEPIFTL